MVDQESIRPRRQKKMNKYNIRKNIKRVYQDYKFRDKVMLNNNSDLKYQTTYKDPFYITQCCKNDTVKLQYGWIKIRYNIRQIKTYISDTKLKISNIKNTDNDSQLMITSYILLYKNKYQKQSK